MEVLETIQTYNWAQWWQAVIFIAAIVLGAKFCSESNTTPKFIACLVSCCIGIATLVTIILGTFKTPSYLKYVVRIDDTYPVVKLYDKYEILYQYPYSNVYEVKEKIN